MFQLAHFLTNPFHAIRAHTDTIRISTALLGVLLASVFMVNIVRSPSVFSVLSFMGLLLSAVFIMTALCDCVAHYMGNKSQAKLLFLWSCTSLSIFIFFQPFFLLKERVSSWVFVLGCLGIYYVLSKCQIVLLKTLYKTTSFQTTLLCLAPGLCYLLFLISMILASVSLVS